MKVLKRYVFRLYPNVEQKILINKTIGSARFIYNIFLSDRIGTYNNTKRVNLHMTISVSKVVFLNLKQKGLKTVIKPTTW